MKINAKYLLFYGRSEVHSNWHKSGFTVKDIFFTNGEQYVNYPAQKGGA